MRRRGKDKTSADSGNTNREIKGGKESGPEGLRKPKLSVEEQKKLNGLLIEATRGGDLKQINELLVKGADINAKDDLGETAIMAAYFYGEGEIAKMLVETYMDSDMTEEHIQDVFNYAYSYGKDFETAKLMLERGADVNKGDHIGSNLLMSAMSKREEIKFLIENGAELDDLDMLQLAWSDFDGEDTNIIKRLVESGMDVDTREKEIGVTLLIMSIVIPENLHKIRFLIEMGADVNAKDYRGASALMYAAVFGLKDTVKFLLDYGADINIQDNRGTTPLMATSLFGRTDIVLLLLERDADLNVRNNDGFTALECLSHGDHLEKLLGSFKEKMKDKLKIEEIKQQDGKLDEIRKILIKAKEDSEKEQKMLEEQTTKSNKILKEVKKKPLEKRILKWLALAIVGALISIGIRNAYLYFKEKQPDKKEEKQQIVSEDAYTETIEDIIE